VDRVVVYISYLKLLSVEYLEYSADGLCIKCRGICAMLKGECCG